jgi:ABC-type spermidine/putrescine transport system permease subunit II
MVRYSPFTGRGGQSAEREIESRIPPLYRLFMVFVVVIPKVVIGASLLFFGGKLVLRSDNNPEVIMNSLAA